MGRARLRRRLVILGWMAFVLVAAAGPGAEAIAPDQGRTVGHVVRPGESLWSIAVAFADGRDPRHVVDLMERENRLAGPTIVPGRLLRVPLDP